MANADGTAQALVSAEEATELGPTWAPDGAQLAFQSDFDLETPSEVYKINADGTGFTQLTDTPGQFDKATSPAWSPDGRKIAFSVGFTATDLYVMNPDGTGVVNLTNTPDPRESEPDWSPDGSKLAFSDGFGVFVMNSDGTGRVRLADGNRPAWSPDGQKIVFVHATSTASEIATIDTDGSGRSVLTSATNPYRVSDPDWQPLPDNTPSTYVRPLGAGRVQTSLVPAYLRCEEPNRTHGPPLAYGSCAPPRTSSTHLTMQPADHTRFRGSVRLGISLGAPGGADDTDVNIRVRVSDVMRAADSSEYTGELRASVGVRLTDKETVGDTRVGQTTVDFPLELDVPCAPTAATEEKALCLLTTSLDTLIPGSVPEGSRAIWALDQVRVYDGGPDEQAATEGDNSLFAVQGVFVP
jgi:dipeptidyl aminopeptidase/acylaminoacyl peptidase